MSAAILPFGDLIRTQEFSLLTAATGNQRKRIFSPDITLRAFLSQVVGRSGSCQEAVTKVHLESLGHLKKNASLNTASYVRARSRLNSDAISQLTHSVHKDMSKNVDERWLWKGRKVTIIDGSTVTMADTTDNVTVFPKRSNQREYNGFPLARVMLASSLETGSVVDFAIAPWSGKGTGEIPLAARLLDRIEGGNILVADAMFPSYCFIGLCQKRHLDVVIRKKPNRQMTILTEIRIGEGDRLIKIKKPRIPHTGWLEETEYTQLPDTLILRETHVTIERIGFRAKSITILSTLIDNKKYSKSDIAELLMERWNIELDLRIIKRELGLNFLRAKTPKMVMKEIWVNLLAFNLIRRLINIASKAIGAVPRRISFNKTLEYYLASHGKKNFSIERISKSVLSAISHFKLVKQIARFEPRVRKTSHGHNDYPNLTMSRRHWKVLQIIPHLEESLVFSRLLREALTELKARVPRVKGKERY